MPSDSHDQEWTVRVSLEEDNGSVVAVAELIDSREGTLSAKGMFHTDTPDRHPAGARHELATARALQRLAELLVTSATERLSGSL